jgi:hypothetical protein
MAAAGAADVERLGRVAAIYDERAERIRLIAHFYALRKRWLLMLGPILGATLFGAGGVVAYQHAASEQRVENEAKAKELPFLRRAPDVVVEFQPGALGKAVGGPCAAERRAVRVAGQRKGQAAFLLRTHGMCKARFVRVDRTLVKIKAVR